MAKKRGLGRGLDSLIPAVATSHQGAVEIPVGAIRPNPRQPRAQIDPEDLTQLADSIRDYGVIQPVVVTRAEDRDSSYVLIAGERRLEAAKLADLLTVPAIVRDDTTDQELLELALIENLQRSDLSPLEAALAYQSLAEDFGLPHEAIAQRVGKQRATVSNAIRLLKLPAAVQKALAKGAISEGHARALLSLRTQQAQRAALETILKKGLNVRQTEELVRKLAGRKKAKNRAAARTPEEIDLENRIQNALGTKVVLRRGRKGRGTLVVHFHSDEELNALAEYLLDEEL